MGEILQYHHLPERNSLYRLLIYSKAISEIASKAIAVNKPIAAELVDLKPSRRTMQLEKCFVKVLESLPEQPIIKDIDVLFNPAYKVDVMKLLSSAYKQKQFSLVWPGTFSDGKLTYSEEGYPDYRVYEINDYDIMYVI
ncbi:MAG: BREX-3 system P-loop-containing protein BrxF [Firmicutes bacterium]|nr:BREX-3 system P-loop-containing protein BrxF [Bacillota bacterium]